MTAGRRGFTLVETLVVLAIMVAVFAMAGGSFLRSDGRVQAVKAAAEELAATCRQARALAVSRNATFAVVFHVQNHPDSNGRVLNNRSGGHSYRIVGPAPSVSTMIDPRSLLDPKLVDNLPPVVGGMTISETNLRDFAYSYPFTLAQTAELHGNSWVGDEHVLPAGKARLLALSDMDYGDYNEGGSTFRNPSATISFPRPWFGWWDKDNVAGGGKGRLYPWGGYDPAIPGSGFYYRGRAAAAAYANIDTLAPVNSRNAVTRRIDRWHDDQIRNGSGKAYSLYEEPAEPQADVLYEADSARPLLNAAWRDVSIAFTASGEAAWGGTMPGRHCVTFRDIAITDAGVTHPRVFRGVAERCNGIWPAKSDMGLLPYPHYQGEMGTFEQDSGGFFITLAPELTDDNDVYPTAKAVIDALMPIYRVYISVVGEVRVIPVSRTAVWPSGKAPFPTTESWYRGSGNMKTYFPRDRLVTGALLSGGVGLGAIESGGPITDVLTTGMLENRSIWLK